MHYSELKTNVDAYHFFIFTRVQTTNYSFLSTDIPSTNIQVIEGIIRALLQKQRHHRHTTRAEHQAFFFSDREKLQNRHDRQLLLEILIKA